MPVNLSRIKTFNTGRQYSAKGQRIACIKLPCGRVMFADADRHIDGITHNAHDDSWEFAGYDVPQFVLMEYDYGRINYGSWEPDVSEAHRANMADTMRQLYDAANAM